MKELKLQHLKSLKAEDQGTDDWHSKREKLLFRGSEAPRVLDRGYVKRKNQSSQADWVNEKLGLKQPDKIWDGFTNHGIQYEPTALRLFKEKYKKETFELGSVTWADALPSRMFDENEDYAALFPLMGGSPDAITTDLELVEVKCPLKRRWNVHQQVPPYYIDQVQFYMWQFDLEKCYFVQYFYTAPPEDQLKINVIERDKGWWVNNKGTFLRLYQRLKKENKI